jgi:hypothetical protein
MQPLVIKAEKVMILKSQYGEEIVNECFSMASKALPGEVYRNIEDQESNLAKCFKELFQELI